MRTLKNNGLVTIFAAKTIKIDQEIEKSRNGNIWTERNYSNKATFYILMIFVFSIRN